MLSKINAKDAAIPGKEALDSQENIGKMEPQTSVGDNVHGKEKSSSNGNIKEQKKDKSLEADVEKDVCRKGSVDSIENMEPVILTEFKEEPCVDSTNCMEKAIADGNGEHHDEEKAKHVVISDFEKELDEIKPKITAFMSEDMTPAPDSSNKTKSTEHSLEKHRVEFKKEVLHCLVNKCPTCTEIFISREAQEQHKCTTPYRCLICMKVLATETDLCSHMLSHKNEPCTICHKTFSNKNYNVKHLKGHCDIGNKCIDCSKVFASLTYFNSPCRMHTGEKPYICEYCGKSFIVIQAYHTHLMQHTGKKPFECSTCFKQFPVKTNLQNHIRIHTGERPYVCEICGNCFRGSAGLWRHTKKVHEQKEKNFKCQLCPREYVQSTELETHMRKHTGERPFECHLCEKKFALKSSLMKHIKVHNGESFDCTVCKRSFASSSSRNRHVRTHTGEKPFRCATCDQAFSLRKDLENHVLESQH